jgi:hypothetical protein
VAYGSSSFLKKDEEPKRIFATFQELPLAIPLNSEKRELFSDSERSEESLKLINFRKKILIPEKW